MLNVVNGFGVEAGKPLASSKRIAKIAFTGETTTGRLIMQYASAEPDPGHAGAGRQVPEHLLRRRHGRRRRLPRQGARRLHDVRAQPGRGLHLPVARLIQAIIYDEFMELAAIRTKAIRQGDPLDTETMIGAQASNDQLEKILSYIDIGKAGRRQGAHRRRARRARRRPRRRLLRRSRPSSRATTRCASSRRRSSARWSRSTTFKDYDDALAIANDTLYGLGAGVWTRDGNSAYRAGRDIQAGRVWTNCYHAYPAHAAFGGYKQSGIGRENHKMMLDHYQQTKNLLVSLFARRRWASSDGDCRGWRVTADAGRRCSISCETSTAR